MLGFFINNIYYFYKQSQRTTTITPPSNKVQELAVTAALTLSPEQVAVPSIQVCIFAETIQNSTLFASLHPSSAAFEVLNHSDSTQAEISYCWFSTQYESAVLYVYTKG